MRRRELDSRLLIMVTLALVAFGLVMVYSATSAAAAVGGKDPSYYLKRQGIYAALGIVLMAIAQRWDYRRLKTLAPTLVMASLGLLVAGLLVVAGAPARTLAAAIAIAAALGTFAIWIEPYRRARFFAFLNPWHDAQGAGFQIVQAMIGMGSGHIFGVGLGQGVQKIFYLPEAHTDMMLANIGEELGLLGVAAVIGAYLLFG